MRAIQCLGFLLYVFFLTSLPAPLKAAEPGRQQSVGLVLSGGGAKGVAHIGVIKALEENGIPIDYITGTSMGAIVGGLYACGYTTDEMMELLLSPYFTAMSKGSIDPAYDYYFTSEPASPRLLSIPLGKTPPEVAKRFDPQSLIAPTPMAFGFMEIFSAYMEQCGGNFDNLFVPYRCVASNISKRRPEIHRSGNLGECVRSSMSFPMVFQPVLMNGDMLVDGGLYDNFPVNVMTEDFHPDIMLGIDVGAPDVWPPNSFIDEISTLVEQPQNHEVPAELGMRMRIDLMEFGLLDFAAAKQIYQIGYDHAMAMMDSIKSRVSAHRAPQEVVSRRAAFKRATPPLSFSKVTVEGASAKQNKFLESFFKPEGGADTISIDRARTAFYRAYSTGKIKTLTPLAVQDGPNTLTLNIEATMKNRLSAGIGGHITSSDNSFLYLSLDYSTLSYRSLSASVGVWLGQSYLAGAIEGSINLDTSFPSAIYIQGVASRRAYHETEKAFFSKAGPAWLINCEYFGKASWGLAIGSRGRAAAGIGGAHLYNSFYGTNDYTFGRDHSVQDLGQVFAGLDFSTIDNINFPTTGYYYSVKVAGVLGKTDYHAATGEKIDGTKRSWAQFNATARHYLDLGRHASLGLEGEAVLSSRPLLETYSASIAAAPDFNPTPASNNYFDAGRRANSYIAVSVVPIWKLNSSFSARVNASCFAPMRRILPAENGTARYSRWFDSTEFFGELDLVYHLPFADLSGYANYSSSVHRFNFGISLGVYLKAPKFL